MGQGAPETGPLPGAPPRDFHMSIEDALLEYAPVTVRFFFYRLQCHIELVHDSNFVLYCFQFDNNFVTLILLSCELVVL